MGNQFNFITFFLEGKQHSIILGTCKLVFITNSISWETDSIQTCKEKDSLALLSKACVIALPCLTVWERETLKRAYKGEGILWLGDRKLNLTCYYYRGCE